MALQALQCLGVVTRTECLFQLNPCLGFEGSGLGLEFDANELATCIRGQELSFIGRART